MHHKKVQIFVESCKKFFVKKDKRVALGRELDTMLKEQTDGTYLLENKFKNFASKNEPILWFMNSFLGFMDSLMFPPYSTYYNYNKFMLDVRFFYRLLKLTNVEKRIIRDLIKITITKQNIKTIVYFLENQLKLRDMSKNISKQLKSCSKFYVVKPNILL